VDKPRTDGYHVFEKPLAHGWILRKITHAEVGAPKGKGCYWDEHELLHSGSGVRVKFPEWEWADMDGQRLAWVAHGKLFAGRLGKEGVFDEVQLFDFNDMAFERIKAPY
jgi:hypothetical protein